LSDWIVYSAKSKSVVTDGKASPHVHYDGSVHFPQWSNSHIRATAYTSASSDERGTYFVCVRYIVLYGKQEKPR